MVDLGCDLLQCSTDKALLLNAEHLFGGRIDDADPPVVDADDSRRYTRKHGFDEAATIIDFVLGLQNLVLLRADFGDHLVECA
ncbi:hypothetical protein D3C80_624580 [compost metagenome]